MTIDSTRTALQFRSLATNNGELELSLASVGIPHPGPNEVLVRVEASPLNPSDIGVMFGGADMSTAQSSGTADRPVVTARIPENAMKSMSARLGASLPAGNEGAGVVVEVGSSPAAQALEGRTVAALGGAMFSQYRCVPVDQCLVLPEGATASEGASSFVNPLTALGMIETVRREGHTALVNTAAASNLGQMLNRLCLHDGIGLVNIVRKQEQEDLLRAQGAIHVLNTASPTFMADLTAAIIATGATIAFDATGGGKVAGQILTCMEAALSKATNEFLRYGTATHKQVYIYGSLNTAPTEINRNFGMAWGIGGWLLFPFLGKIGTDGIEKLKHRVAAELTSTFASHYAKEVSLAEMLDVDVIASYTKRATGEKYLISPSRG